MKRRVPPSVSRRTFLAGVASIPALSDVSSTAHGAAPSATRLDVERFVDEVKRARLESDGQKAVEEVLRRTVSNPKAVLQGLGEPTEAGIHTVYRGDDLTILNVIWGPMMTVLPHNHHRPAPALSVFGTE